MWMMKQHRQKRLNRMDESPTNQNHFVLNRRRAREYHKTHRSHHTVVLLGQIHQARSILRRRVSRAHGSSLTLSCSRGVPVLYQQPCITRDPTTGKLTPTLKAVSASFFFSRDKICVTPYVIGLTGKRADAKYITRLTHVARGSTGALIQQFCYAPPETTSFCWLRPFFTMGDPKKKKNSFGTPPSPPTSYYFCRAQESEHVDKGQEIDRPPCRSW